MTNPPTTELFAVPATAHETITVQINNVFSNRDVCEFCELPGACAGALVFTVSNFGYACIECAASLSPALMAALVTRFGNAMYAQDLPQSVSIVGEITERTWRT